MSELYHSVTLDAELCKGCTNCIKRCPTEAIRVRDGKAIIINDRCIDCGKCIVQCPYHAKGAVYDTLDKLKAFDYTIALPPPALYGQFNNLDDIDYILTGLLELGFDDIFEVSKSAEIISDATRKLIKEGNLKTPIISSACPAIVRLIKISYPELCENVLPLEAPMHHAAKAAKLEAQKKTGLSLERIGVFFITPCPAKVTDARQPIGVDKSYVDGAIAMSEIYPKLLNHMNKVKTPKPLQHSGIIGVSWASSGGEAAALIRERYLAADGLENVRKVLEELENERIRDLDFIELNACPGGCVGGVLTVENPFIAKARVNILRKHLPVSLNHFEGEFAEVEWTEPIKPAKVAKLSNDMAKSLQMLKDIESYTEILPGLDCGSCGAPSCFAQARDIVLGYAHLNDCVFVLRHQASSAGIHMSNDPRQIRLKDDDNDDSQ